MIPSPHKSNLHGASGPMHPTPPKLLPRAKTQRIGSQQAVSVCIYGFKLVVFLFFCTGLFVFFGALLKGVV